MVCHNCQTEAKKHGKSRQGIQRFRCRACNKTFIEPQTKPLDTMRNQRWSQLKHNHIPNRPYALYFAYYNFCRVHSSLRVTPAMESGITDHVWSIGELLAV